MFINLEHIHGCEEVDIKQWTLHHI